MPPVVYSVARVTAAAATVSTRGILKRGSTPALVLLEPMRQGAALTCTVLCVHPGLPAGPYELEGGDTVILPADLADAEQPRVLAGATLEVA